MCPDLSTGAFTVVLTVSKCESASSTSLSSSPTSNVSLELSLVGEPVQQRFEFPHESRAGEPLSWTSHGCFLDHPGPLQHVQYPVQPPNTDAEVGFPTVPNPQVESLPSTLLDGVPNVAGQHGIGLTAPEKPHEQISKVCWNLPRFEKNECLSGSASFCLLWHVRKPPIFIIKSAPRPA